MSVARVRERFWAPFLGVGSAAVDFGCGGGGAYSVIRNVGWWRRISRLAMVRL